MIVRAAIKCIDAEVYHMPAPYRHHHIIHDLFKRGIDIKFSIQGFLDSNGNFLDRVEAAKHAIECRQIKNLSFPPDLYTEDLW